MYPGAPTMGGMPPTGPGQHGMGHPTPMNAPMQQQRRIDPDQMPSPVSVSCAVVRPLFYCAEHECKVQKSAWVS